MTGAENLMNTLINSLSMIDRGFTVTLTVTPHNWDGDHDEDYDEEDDDDEPRVSDEVIEDIKEFARRIDEGMSENLKSQMLDHYERLFKKQFEGHGSLADVFRKMDADSVAVNSWPGVGDTVWYKAKSGKYQCGKVKVVCHNTIQLDNNVTLERKDCMKVPFEVGEEVWFGLCSEILCGYVEKLNDANCLLRTKHGVLQMPYARLFDTVDDLLGYLKSTADE